MDSSLIVDGCSGYRSKVINMGKIRVYICLSNFIAKIPQDRRQAKRDLIGLEGINSNAAEEMEDVEQSSHHRRHGTIFRDVRVRCCWARSNQGACIGVFGEINHPGVPCESGCASIWQL